MDTCKNNMFLFFVICVVVFPHFAQSSYNIALGKPAAQSSTTGGWVANKAVDGVIGKDFESSGGGSCSSTSDHGEPEAWWRVDLQQMTRIKSINITYRELYPFRLSGFYLYVANTTAMNNLSNTGHLCYHDNTRDPALPSFNQSRPCNVDGRYVIFYNKRPADNGPKSHVYYSTTEAVVELCEVQVFGCPMNTFGPTCYTPCHCGRGGCDPDTGICDVTGCQRGWKGPSCSTVCGPGRFGENCKDTCHCAVPGCDRFYGTCAIAGCESGWTGSACDQDISTPTPTAQTSNVTTTTPTSPLTRSDIDCGGSSISLHVPLDLLPSGQQVTWNDPACVVSNNGTHLTGDIDLGECGTYVFFNATHVIFENELVSHASTANSTSGAHSVIDYGNGPDSVIVVQCVYPRREQESLGFRPIQGQVRLYEKTLGHMQVHMREARDVRFDDMYPSQTEPRVVHLNDPIYIKLDTEQGNTTKVAINVDRCLATPSPSPLDTDFQELTDNGCPALPSVTIHSSPVSEVHLSFQAFKFTNHPSAPVYVHCEVYVCPLSDPHCVTGCTDSVARTRRAATGGIKTHLVSTGPFPVADDKDQGGFGGESTALVAVTGLCAVLAVAATIFGVMAWRGRRRLSLKEPLVQ